MPSEEMTATNDKSNGAMHRDRLLEGMAGSVNEKGFAETTIADIARHAKVSKRTFYEHFANKQDCLLALYVETSERALARIADSIDPSLDLDAQLTKTAKVYFLAMQESPGPFPALLIEILAAGPRGIKVRRQVHRRYAELLRELIASVQTKDKEHYELSPLMAIAVVSGLYELLLEAIEVEEESPERLGELAQSAAEMLRSASSLVR